MPKHAIKPVPRRGVRAAIIGAAATLAIVAGLVVVQPWSAALAPAPSAAPTTTSTTSAVVQATAAAATSPTPTPTPEPLPAPKQLSLSEVADGKATLTWEPVDGADAYVLRFSTAKSMAKAKTVVVAKGTETTLEVPNNVKQYAQVAASTEKGVLVGRLSKVLPFAVAPLDVASYNIHCSSCHKSGKLSWPARRANVVRIIEQEDPAALGLQEALTTRGQIAQLMSSLGKRYALVPAPAIKDGSRIIYQPALLKLVSSGIRRLPGSGFGRYANWAIFEQRLTGKRFFFLSTHLAPGKGAANTRAKQTRTLVSTIRANAGKLPVIAAGDYNAYKFDGTGNKPFAIMQAAGYLDPLGNAYRSHGSAPGAFVDKRINTNYDTSNRFLPGPPRKSYINGTAIDYLFMTPTITVAEFEVVVRVNARGRWTMSPIPSDHNMIRARTFLPN